jgi:restriction system protein
MECLTDDKSAQPARFPDFMELAYQWHIRCCPSCGWWTVWENVITINRGPIKFGKLSTVRGAIGSLRELDLTDQSVPIEEIRDYLTARYDARFHVDPWKFEETVASVYKDLGFRADVTARSKDGGIDVILEGPGGEVIGVQVKRYKNSINVEQIRSFTGALFLEGMTSGIFITTSSYQSGVIQAVEKSSIRGIPIELIDAERFYHALGIAQREMYKNIKDRSAPFLNSALMSLEE